jgi:hypothetical protein
MGSSLPIATTWAPTWTARSTFLRRARILPRFEMFPHHIIHAECVGGDIDLLCNRRATIGFFPWQFVDGESSIGRCVAMVDNDEYEELMARKANVAQTRFGDAYDPEHVENIQRLTRRVCTSSGTRPTTLASPNSCANWPARTTR